MPIAIYGTFSVEIHPNLFAFGVLTTLFSFALLTVYGILMTASVSGARRREARDSGGHRMSPAVPSSRGRNRGGIGIGRAIALRLAA